MKDRERYNISCSYSNKHDKRIIEFLDNETISSTTWIKQLMLDYLNGKLVYQNSINEIKTIDRKEETIVDNFEDLDIDLGI